MGLNFTLKREEADIEDIHSMKLSFPESIAYSEALRNGSQKLPCNVMIEVGVRDCPGGWCPTFFDFNYIGNVKLLLRALDAPGTCLSVVMSTMCLRSLHSKVDFSHGILPLFWN